MLEDCASNIIDVLEICYNFLSQIMHTLSLKPQERFLLGRGCDEFIMRVVLSLSVQAVHDAFAASTPYVSNISHVESRAGANSLLR